MRCGISTACFYPESTLKALGRVASLGAPVAEVFINCRDELLPQHLAQLKAVAKKGSMEIVSLHPYESPLENIWFATRYMPRVKEGIHAYRPYFEAGRFLGAKLFVLHGMSLNNNDLSLEEYAENLARLIDAGREYGVQVCLENVAYCKLGKPENVRTVRDLLGERAAFVLDLKQMLRFGASLEDMLAAMEGHIAHVHISDCRPGDDCIAPGLGCFNFARLAAELRRQGYGGDMVIELYQSGFGPPEELKTAMEAIQLTVKDGAQ